MTHAINSKSARDRLEPRREPYWARVRAGVYVGFRKLDEGGSWIARRRADDGKQQYKALGEFDSLDAASKAVDAWARGLDEGVQHTATTVDDACAHYVKHLAMHNSAASAKDARGRFKRLINGRRIGSIDLSKLRTSDLKAWVAAQVQQDDDTDEETMRKAKDSANRNLTSLKAALNLAMRDRLVSTDAGWKTVVPFKDVGARREGFLNADQRRALVAGCPDDLRALVTAMLLTGARPGELAGANASHFDKSAGTLALDGKTGARTVYLSNAAVAFFTEQAKDKIGAAPILTASSTVDGRWHKDAWKGPFRAACEAAKLPDTVVMYSLRHAAISEMIIGGVDVFSVARLTGTSSAMIDKHYGHLCGDRMRAKLDAIAML